MGHYYNETQKQQYLDAFEKAMLDANAQKKNERCIPRIKKIFEQTAPVEEEIGKDISEFNQTDVNKLYSEYINKFTSMTAQYKLMQLYNYLIWCRDEGIITGFQFECHPLSGKYIGGGKERTSKRFTERYDVLVGDVKKNNNIYADDFVFETQDGLFRYFETLLYDDRWLMLRVCLYLMYYGFDNSTIISIKKNEVDSENHSVCGVTIDNVRAFDAIYKAKFADSYVIPNEYNGRRIMYIPSDYLIRGIGQGKVKGQDDDGMISINFVRRAKTKLTEASKGLPMGSPYKEIGIVPSHLAKQHYYHIVRREELNTSLEYVSDKLKRDAYDFRFSLYDYKVMRAVAKDI